MKRALVAMAFVAVGLSAFEAAAKPPKRATAKPRTVIETTLAEKLADGLAAALSGQGTFRVDGCPGISPTQWASLLLLGDGVPTKYVFAPGCDAEGEAVLRRDAFPLDLQVRNLAGVERLHATVDAEAKPDWANGVVRAEIRFRDGTLEGGKAVGPVAFTAALRVATGLDEQTAPEPEGEIRIYKVRGQTVDVRRTFGTTRQSP